MGRQARDGAFRVPCCQLKVNGMVLAVILSAKDGPIPKSKSSAHLLFVHYISSVS